MDKITFFKSQSDFRKWLDKNHNKAAELVVGFYKVGTGKKSIGYKESVDEALCFGWIDGIRKSLGEESYTIRFTPRRPGSIWSRVNINRAKELEKLGLMKSQGLKTFHSFDKKKTNRYSFEQKIIKLSKDYEKQFKANKKAWQYFQSMPPSYQRPAIWWVMSAKHEETRLRRLKTLICDSEAGRKIKVLTLERNKN
jgi:uncharacterized protein YdeI (YjbR/CyaY-like superfamily)